jgi:sugar (pentulose or hexulose) kinase
MKMLGIDVGSSSVKAAVLVEGKVRGEVVRAEFKTWHEGVRVEVDAEGVLRAIKKAIGQVGTRAKQAEVVGLSVMSPSWVAMDKSGRALTPVITHQDRRSVVEAKEIEAKVGKERFLQVAGNRPVPGGISVTSWEWYREHEPALLKRADLVGHLNTLIHRQMTGARVVDPANASFMGVYQTVTQGGWSDELCEAVGLRKELLPDVMEADRVAGHVSREGARSFGLPEGTPVLTGIVDTSSAMLLSGADEGQFTNNCGSTDVLGLCVSRGLPHERLLTRALGVGKKWMSVSTIAAAGTALDWARSQLFADFSMEQFWKLVKKMAREGKSPRKREEMMAGVCFDPYLAGERTSVEQRKAAFTGLTLSTTREHMLAAVIEALAAASAARLELFAQLGVPLKRKIMATGGSKGGLAELFHRDWKGKWSFWEEKEATLRGLAKLEPKE